MEGSSIPQRPDSSSREGSMKEKSERFEEEPEPSMEFVTPFGKKIVFDVQSNPVPQGSTRAFIVKNRPIITSTSKKLGDWRHLVASAAQNRVDDLIEGPVAITLHFRLPRPKSAPKKKRTYADKRPDLDKLIRAVLDAITGVIVRDDSQIVAITAIKDYGSPPGVRVEIDQVEG